MTGRRASPAPEVIDLPRARETLARPSALAREHPGLTGPSSPENAAAWEATLALDDHGDDMPDPTTQCAFRLPDSLVARLDAFAEKLNAEEPGRRATRADAVRILLTRALDGAAAAARTRNRAPRKPTRAPTKR